MTMAAESTANDALRIVRDATCTRCGCACDDIDLSIQNNRIVAAERACELGKAWFFAPRPDDGPACFVEGRPASFDEGIERAAQILAAARYPLVYGLTDTTTEAQRIAVGIADWIGGTVDTTTSVFHGPQCVSFQGVGEVTCSLGEIANRGDLILFWGTNPAESHPRHFERYSLLPTGMFVPRGRADRTCVVVDVHRTATAEEADVFLQIKPGRDFEALWILRALAQGIELDADQVERQTGVLLSAWQDLIARMKQARFGVMLFGMGLTMTRGKHINGEAVLALVRDMNAYTRFVAKPMREGGNVVGADDVVAWRTGYPFGVNLSRGYPRFGPGEYTADEMLARRETDAALIVACDVARNLSPQAREHLATIPSILVGSEQTDIARSATVAFRTATYGINTPGTVYRMDGVPIPLRPAIDSPHPSDLEVLSALEARVRQIKDGVTAETVRSAQ